jgi:hypothetical protein
MVIVSHTKINLLQMGFSVLRGVFGTIHSYDMVIISMPLTGRYHNRYIEPYHKLGKDADTLELYVTVMLTCWGGASA